MRARLPMILLCCTVLACKQTGAAVEAGLSDRRTERSSTDAIREGGAGGDRRLEAGRLIPEWKLVSGASPAVIEHTATLLDDGRVLIAGGETRSGVQPATSGQAWLYLPDQDRFQPAPALRHARSEHTATRLGDGRVLIAGGTQRGVGSVRSAELFVPTGGGAWLAAPDLPEPRSAHAAVSLTDGRVLLVGGEGPSGSLDSLVLYEPKTGTFSTAPIRMSRRRSGPSATLLATTGKVLLAGGFDGATYLASAELFDPATGLLTVLPAPMSSARAEHTADRLADSRVLIVGGFCGEGCAVPSDEVFDPQAGLFRTVLHAGTPPAFAATVLLPDGRLLASGGQRLDRVPLSAAAAFAPASSIWQQLPGMLFPRALHTATLLAGGTVLMVGGQRDSVSGGHVDRAERFIR